MSSPCLLIIGIHIFGANYPLLQSTYSARACVPSAGAVPCRALHRCCGALEPRGVGAGRAALSRACRPAPHAAGPQEALRTPHAFPTRMAAPPAATPARWARPASRPPRLSPRTGATTAARRSLRREGPPGPAPKQRAAPARRQARAIDRRWRCAGLRSRARSLAATHQLGAVHFKHLAFFEVKISLNSKGRKTAVIFL